MDKIKMTVANYDKCLVIYGDDPVLFCREVCGIEPCSWQVRFLDALRTDKFISRPSGHSIGKTFITSVGMLWMLCFFPDCNMKVTSSNYSQARDAIWAAFKQTIGGSAVSEWFSVGADKVFLKLFPGNWAHLLSWSKEKLNAWAGGHAESSVGIFDECSDIGDFVFEAWQGSAYHKRSRTILLGQPLFRRGRLFESARDQFLRQRFARCGSQQT